MILFPPAKINLGLHVLRRRTDGYHDIDSVFYPVNWKDILEIIPSPDGKFSFFPSGIPVPVLPEQNLVVRAWRIMEQIYRLPPVHLYLHKTIPPGSGLGGGSSDAASTLVLLNRMFSLGLANDTLRNIAAGIGSDCPFFIDPVPAHVSGRGEKIVPFWLQLPAVIIVVPPLNISTASAYAGIKPREREQSVTDILQQPFSLWKELLFNDFGQAAALQFPQIQKIRESLYSNGAFYVSMTGSGSAVYGLFDNAMPDVERMKAETGGIVHACDGPGRTGTGCVTGSAQL